MFLLEVVAVLTIFLHVAACLAVFFVGSCSSDLWSLPQPHYFDSGPVYSFFVPLKLEQPVDKLSEHGNFVMTPIGPGLVAWLCFRLRARPHV